MTRSASGITVSKMKMSTLQAAEATTAIDQQALVPVSTQVLASMPHDPSHGENDTVPAIDAGSREVAEVAGSVISTDPGGAEYQVGGAWNWVDIGEEDEEWTKVCRRLDWSLPCCVGRIQGSRARDPSFPFENESQLKLLYCNVPRR